MKNEEVKEIFDEIIVNLFQIANRLELYRDWIRSGRAPDLSYEEWLMETPIETPGDYLEYILERLKLTREFFQDWRSSKKLGGEK